MENNPNLRVEEKPDCLIVFIDKEMNTADVDPCFADLYSKLGKDTPKSLVLDFGGEPKANRHLVRFLALLSRALRVKGKKVEVAHILTTDLKYIESNGMGSSVSISQRPNFSGVVPPKIDVNFVNPFITGAIETLRVQSSVEVHPEKIFLKGKSTECLALTSVDIAAVIGLTSTVFKGSVAICFPQAIFLAIMGNMFGETYTEITQELEDGASELLNIIFGIAKRALNTQGYSIERALPTIVRGKDINVRHMSDKPTIVVPFQTKFGPFHIEIATEGST